MCSVCVCGACTNRYVWCIDTYVCYIYISRFTSSSFVMYDGLLLAERALHNSAPFERGAQNCNENHSTFSRCTILQNLQQFIFPFYSCVCVFSFHVEWPVPDVCFHVGVKSLFPHLSKQASRRRSDLCTTPPRAHWMGPLAWEYPNRVAYLGVSRDGPCESRGLHHDRDPGTYLTALI